MSFATMTEMQIYGAALSVVGLADMAFAFYRTRGGDAMTRAVGGLVLWMGGAMVVAGPIFYFVSDERTALWGGIAAGAVTVAIGVARTIFALRELRGQQG